MKADVVVSCSKEISDDLAEQYRLDKTKLKVIYNGVDRSQIQTAVSETHTDEETNSEKLIVTMGRMAREKGQWFLLRVVGYLRGEGLNVRLVILGEGRMRRTLENICCKLGIREAVDMPGRVADPYAYLQKADAAVFTSLFEGFCNAILESLACHVPCVSTDHKTGAREILAPGTDYREKVKGRIDYAEFGVLVPVCDGNVCEYDAPLSEEELLLAKAIKRILTDDDINKQYRGKGRLRAEELSMEEISRQWADLIEEACR